jgi:hypothetical protein
MFRTFNSYVLLVIGANQTAVFVKCMIGELEQIAVRVVQLQNRVQIQPVPVNVMELQNRATDVRIKPPIQTVDVIYTNNKNEQV